MQTIKTISNVSYNTPKFFENKILELEENGVIEWCYWVYHLADEDEKKDHIHFVLRPCKRLDTQDLRKHLFEFDPEHPNKPKTCTKVFKFTNSMDDWLLYAVHDTAYLRMKGQVRTHKYEYKDLRATDEDALLQDWQSIDKRKYMALYWLEEAVENNVPFYELISKGLVPIQQRSMYEFQYKDLLQAKFNKEHGRSGRKESHEDDDENGNPFV